MYNGKQIPTLCFTIICLKISYNVKCHLSFKVYEQVFIYYVIFCHQIFVDKIRPFFINHLEKSYSERKFYVKKIFFVILSLI